MHTHKRKLFPKFDSSERCQDQDWKDELSCKVDQQGLADWSRGDISCYRRPSLSFLDSHNKGDSYYPMLWPFFQFDNFVTFCSSYLTYLPLQIKRVFLDVGNFRALSFKTKRRLKNRMKPYIVCVNQLSRGLFWPSQMINSLFLYTTTYIFIATCFCSWIYESRSDIVRA